MNQQPELSLDNVKRSLEQKSAPKTFRVSDFLSSEQVKELHKATAEGNKKKKRLFDDIDALGAEICARFGYETYLAWNDGDFDTDQMFRWIRAERARDEAKLLDLENIIIQMVGSCIRIHKGEKKPQGPKEAHKIWNNQLKRAKGEL